MYDFEVSGSADAVTDTGHKAEVDEMLADHVGLLVFHVLRSRGRWDPKRLPLLVEASEEHRVAHAHQKICLPFIHIPLVMCCYRLAPEIDKMKQEEQ